MKARDCSVSVGGVIAMVNNTHLDGRGIQRSIYKWKLVYNGHINSHDGIVRQVESTNELQTHGKISVRQYSQSVK